MKKRPLESGSLFAAPEPEAKREYDARGMNRANVPTSLVELPGYPMNAPPSSEVIVEMVGEDAFIVSLLRDHGTTVAAVKYSRGMLKQLIRRATAALEGG